MTEFRAELPLYFAKAHSRRGALLFGIRPADRLSHVYIIGKTGTGKSTLIETMILEDIRRGNGVALIDPHGDLVSRVADAIPDDRRPDVTYLNVPDLTQPYRYNPLRRVHADRIPLAASGLLESMKKAWSDSWGVRMEHILRNAIHALLEQKNSTLADILRLFSDKSFRRSVARNVTNEPVRAFWEKEFERYSFGYRADGVASIQNKIGAFLADPVMRRIFIEPGNELRVRRIIDNKGILLVNLSKGQVGEDSASLLGAFLVTTIGLAAFSRANQPAEDRIPFFVYVDEFQSFTTLSMANMLAEMRKFGVGLTFAHQYLAQLEPDVRHAVLGNVGTLIAFRVGAEDAPYLSREFGGKFDEGDLINQPNYAIYLKLMIDGMPSAPFSADTLLPN